MPNEPMSAAGRNPSVSYKDKLIASTLQAAAERVRHYTDDKAYNDAIDNAIVAILEPLNKMDEVEGNS